MIPNIDDLVRSTDDGLPEIPAGWQDRPEDDPPEDDATLRDLLWRPERVELVLWAGDGTSKRVAIRDVHHVRVSMRDEPINITPAGDLWERQEHVDALTVLEIVGRLAWRR